MKKKACFICGTPYHVLSSIIIKYQLNIDADIIIYDAFDNTDKLKYNLQIEHIFDNVSILSREKDCGIPHSVWGKYWYAFTGYFSIKRLVTRIIPDINSYTDVFFANDQIIDIVDRFIWCYTKKYMQNSKIHYIEDGWVSYEESYYRLTLMDRIFRRLIVRGGTHILDMDLYLYSKQLYYSVNSKPHLIVNEIEKPSSMIVGKLKRVFSYIFLDDISNFNTIVLDTVRDEEFNQDGSERFNEIIKSITKKQGTIVKSHPRDNKKYFDYTYFTTNGFPFEILCLYNDFSNYTFINNSSNAVFTPKLLFDQEPKLVFTYPLLIDKMNYLSSNRDVVISCFRKMYKDKKKIVVLYDENAIC